MFARTRNLIHRAFDIGILLKALNAVLEIMGGVLLLVVSPATVNNLARVLTQGELSEDPKDLVANFLLRTAGQLSVNGHLFGALFLLSHGIIKLALIAALFKRKLWAYPAAMAIFGLFIVYQLYRYSLSHSAWMLILSALDAAVIILTWLEYQNLKSDD